MLVACSRAMHHSIPLTSVLLAASTDAWGCAPAGGNEGLHPRQRPGGCTAGGQRDQLRRQRGPQRGVDRRPLSQAHMARAKGLSLCLFDRRSRTAQATPADDWR